MKLLGTKILLKLIPVKQSQFDTTIKKPTTGTVLDCGPTAKELGINIGDEVVFDKFAPIDVGCGHVIDYGQVITVIERLKGK